MRRILVAAALVVLGTVSVASPAQAANGPWSVVSAGGIHTCAINTGKSLYCWGSNGFGQIGDGTIILPRPSPTKIGASGVWASVAAGLYHTCAITTDKSLYCWGDNEAGQVGDGTTNTERLSPTQIGASGIWASVAAGGYGTCAITTDKSLYCWGGADVGDGTTENRPSPTKIGASGSWASVAAGEYHTCAITTDKSLYCWGYNVAGQVGDGTTDNRLSPTKIGSSGVWARAATGDFHTCATRTNNSLYCWGYNGFGQIGDGTTTTRPSPRKIGASGVWTHVSAGGEQSIGHTCATRIGGFLYCWGNNFDGQVGDGTRITPRLTPTKVRSGVIWAASTAGANHTCAISTGKSLYCWGDNDIGQIGDGTENGDRPSPVKVP